MVKLTLDLIHKNNLFEEKLKIGPEAIFHNFDFSSSESCQKFFIHPSKHKQIHTFVHLWLIIIYGEICLIR